MGSYMVDNINHLAVLIKDSYVVQPQDSRTIIENIWRGSSRSFLRRRTGASSNTLRMCERQVKKGWLVLIILDPCRSVFDQIESSKG